MKRRSVGLVISPGGGKNLARLSDILAVFSAADWKTDTAVKEFGGHTLQLAKDAAKAGHDLVIAYGGDGTLNQVINGVMAHGDRDTIVGVIPGGTANVWAHEIGLPEDPLQSALLLVNSDSRSVDLGHVQEVTTAAHHRHRHERFSTGGRDYFLLMAGLGLDAAVMRYVSSPLKKKFGRVAVALSAVKQLLFRAHKSFLVDVRSSDDGKASGVLWSGQAIQVVVGNTRHYGGDIVEATPEAYLDDGMLDVCVITAGNPLSTFQQIVSTLIPRKRPGGSAEYFRGAHFWITVPASVHLQLDGSLVKRSAGSGATATYRFDAVPRALRMAVPCTYDDKLFRDGAGQRKAPSHRQELERRPHRADRAMESPPNGSRFESPAELAALLEHGRKVTVTGVAPNPQRQGNTIIAGDATGKNNGESRPVAVRTDRHTSFVKSSGEPLSPSYATELQDGGEIVVEGKQSKRGVIHATRVVVPR